MKKLLLVPFLLMSVLLTGCYETVPPGYVGKIAGKEGFQPEIIPPSRIWLSTTFTQTPEKLYFVQTTTQKYVEPIKIKLKDKMNITTEIIFRGRIVSNKKILNSIFNDIPMNDAIVTTTEVYNTYAKMVILNTARSIISQYNVDEIPTNQQRITVELYNAIKPKLEGLPIEISDVTLGPINYPEIVDKAIEAAKKRQMDIQQEKADVQVKLTKKRGEEELAKADYKIKMLEAKRIRDYNAMTAQGITPALIKLRELELREKELDKWNGTLPQTYMGSSGGNIPVIVSPK